MARWAAPVSGLLVVGAGAYFWDKAVPVAQDIAARIAVAGVTVTDRASGPFGDILSHANHLAEVDAVRIAPERLVAMEKVSDRCWTASLVVQALTGRPLLMGVSPEGSACVSPAPYYGWADYGAGARSRPVSDEELCRHALNSGVTQVMSVGEKGDVTRLYCGADGSLNVNHIDEPEE